MDAQSGSNCPHEDIIALYHEALPMCPKVRQWTDTRKKLLRSRWREDRTRQSLDWWREFFARVAGSEFLTGKTEPKPGRPPFCVDLEWLIKPGNFVKVEEGRYHNEPQEPETPSWWETAAGVLQRARELGVEQRDGEPVGLLKERVRREEERCGTPA